MNDQPNENKLRILQASQAAAAHDHGHDHDHEEHQAPADQEHRLDLAAVREKLRDKSGKQYWRTLEELADNPHFEDLIHREFPRHASEWDDAVDRRNFLKLMGASLALAGLAGCGRPDIDHIVPYVKQPDGMVLGKPNFYATAVPFGPSTVGILVESHEGRPTKIEGNPDHPSSLGATSALVQASILNLYDPDRSQTVQQAGEIRSWSAFLETAQGLATNAKATNGAGFRILSGAITSPTLIAQIRKLLTQFPEAKWYQWEPAGGDGAQQGAKLAFGRNVHTVYEVSQANVIVSLDSDFLASGPGHVAYARQFAQRRNLSGSNDTMNRLYVIEPTPSVTGSSSDHRLPVRSSDVELFARALAGKLGVGSGAALSGEAAKWVDVIAGDLRKQRGASLVVAGEYQPASVHALAHAINASLGNVGNTLYYMEPLTGDTGNLDAIRDLCSEMDHGKVDLLLMLGGNPVYDAPHDFDFVNKLKRVSTAIHLSPYFDETSAYCQWHVAESHFLETWSDARAHDGTASIIQPLISPLYYTHSAHDMIAAFSDKPGTPAYDTVRAYWTEASTHLPTAIDIAWRKWLNDGVIGGTKFPAVNAELKFSVASLPAVQAAPADQIEYIFRPDPTVHDGRFANNGWLQELPKPVTKLTWDNAALISPKLAQQRDFAHKVQSRGGEHGQVRSPLVDIELNGSKVTAAVWTLPGQEETTVVLPLGYGRSRAGYTGTNKGFNAYVVRTSETLWTATGGKMTATDDSYPLACTQYHFNMEGRKILSSGTLSEYLQNPGFAHEGDETPSRDDSLYHPFAYNGHAWGMSIDLTKCNGCNACVIACVSENNIPVVGKDQVMRGREMHWIRVDRYYANTVSATSGQATGDPSEYNPTLDNPETFFQPVPCQQCENAPCEQVCPVGATTHSAEGLNDMVYNRCIGTRYCSNNCPYKVRRFNFLRFQDWDTPQFKLMRNPEVTIRSRGVMEKCTYCVQRINNVRIDSEKQNRPIRDGEIVTACESACPTQAITFGDINDPNSKVAKLKAQQRNYTILGELNSRPRTTYLAAVRNPNPELEKA
ncbi:MAG: TAT-variant-translocated molybdopterin oxidoreductase [Candidatus Acidiferrum sp.]|jgi:MoCo/4Fe-4S cofactor protein with predicted Tat translocation signal